VAGVTLGETGSLPADVRAEFRTSGLYHLVSVDKRGAQPLRRPGQEFDEAMRPKPRFATRCSPARFALTGAEPRPRLDGWRGV